MPSPFLQRGGEQSSDGTAIRGKGSPSPVPGNAILDAPASPIRHRNEQKPVGPVTVLQVLLSAIGGAFWLALAFEFVWMLDWWLNG